VAAAALLATVGASLAGADPRLEPVVLALAAAGLGTAASVAGARRLLRGTAVATAVAVGLALPATPAAGALEALEAGVCLAIAALGVVVLTGWGGQVFLAPLALSGGAAWTTARLAGDLGQPPAAAVAGGLAVAGVLGLVSGAVCAAQRSPAGVAILSLGLAGALDALTSDLRPAAASPAQALALPEPLQVGALAVDGRAATWDALLLVLGACLLAVAVARRRLRPALRAAAGNPLAAAVRGVDVVAVRRDAYLLAGVLAGVAGCAAVSLLPAVPDRLLGPAASLRLVGLVALLGRTRSRSAVLAGLVCGVVPALDRAGGGAWVDLALGAAVLVRLHAGELWRRSHKSLRGLIGRAASRSGRSVTASRESPARLRTMSRDAD
jgi:ABC-type branched-subunit amino acid transport system permease subunit